MAPARRRYKYRLKTLLGIIYALTLLGGFFARMGTYVLVKGSPLPKVLRAYIAFEGLFAFMDKHVLHKGSLHYKGLPAHITLEGPFIRVGTYVVF